MEEQDLKLIFNAIESGRCLAFLGAGACTAYRKTAETEDPGLPTSSELAQWLAKECDYPNGTLCDLSYDLSKVSEYYLYNKNGDRHQLEDMLRQRLNIDCTPRPIHSVLAQLYPIKFVITSNYDTLLEQALKQYGRNLIKNVYSLNESRAGSYEGKYVFFEQDQKDVILHKMHGCIDVPNSLVITQRDYIRYLANLQGARGMPNYFRNLMAQSPLLFLGYSLEDWTFQVLWEGVISSQANAGFRCDAYALVKAPKHFHLKIWRQRNIEIFDYDLTEFAKRLAEHFKLDIPQLNIEKGVQK